VWLRVENSEQILQDRSCVRVWHMLWMRMTTRPAASDLDIHACSKSMADSREAAETWNESCLPLGPCMCPVATARMARGHAPMPISA